MRVTDIGRKLDLHFKRIGLSEASRIKLSPGSYSRLLKYSTEFFRDPPKALKTVAALQEPDLASHGLMAITLSGVMDVRTLNVPFIKGEFRNVPRANELLVPELESLSLWTREYINNMPQVLKMSIFSQKINFQSGYRKFMSQNPELRLFNVIDVSSGRFFSQRSAYRLMFIGDTTGQKASFILKPPSDIKEKLNRQKNEEFYSRYLNIFGRNEVSIRNFDDLTFVEYVEGMPSRELARNGIIDPRFSPLKGQLIEWFSSEAALADMVSKGDRTIGLNAKSIWGNYIFVLSPDGGSFNRIVSIDHEFLLDRTDNFTLDSARRGLLEMTILTVFPEYAVKEGRVALQEEFMRGYLSMRSAIIGKRQEVIRLIKKYYGQYEVETFEMKLEREPNAWLEMLTQKMDIYYKENCRALSENK